MKDNFCGEFEQNDYKVKKTYLDTESRHTRLYHTRFTPVDPKYSMCIIHGFGQHSGRFYPIADFYAKKGFEVYLVDLRGFGYSGAARGCGTVPKLVNDVIRLLREVRQDLPLFMYAHSLGGLIVIKLLLNRPGINISGCIITSPLLGFPKEQFPWPKLQVLKLLGDGMQDFVINSMVNPTALTKNSEFIQTIMEDRLMIPFLSLKMGKSVIEAVEEVEERKKEFRFPIIIFHGKADVVTNFEDSQKFIYCKISAFKQIHLFQNGFHELQHDIEKDELLEASMRFIDSLPNKPAVGSLNVLPIETIAKKSNTKKYIIIAIIVFLIILKKVKNISILGTIFGLIHKK